MTALPVLLSVVIGVEETKAVPANSGREESPSKTLIGFSLVPETGELVGERRMRPVPSNLTRARLHSMLEGLVLARRTGEVCDSDV